MSTTKEDALRAVRDAARDANDTQAALLAAMHRASQLGVSGNDLAAASDMSRPVVQDRVRSWKAMDTAGQALAALELPPDAWNATPLPRGRFLLRLTVEEPEVWQRRVDNALNAVGLVRSGTDDDGFPVGGDTSIWYARTDSPRSLRAVDLPLLSRQLAEYIAGDSSARRFALFRLAVQDRTTFGNWLETVITEYVMTGKEPPLPAADIPALTQDRSVAGGWRAEVRRGVLDALRDAGFTPDPGVDLEVLARKVFDASPSSLVGYQRPAVVARSEKG